MSKPLELHDLSYIFCYRPNVFCFNLNYKSKDKRIRNYNVNKTMQLSRKKPTTYVAHVYLRHEWLMPYNQCFVYHSRLTASFIYFKFKLNQIFLVMVRDGRPSRRTHHSLIHLFSSYISSQNTLVISLPSLDSLQIPSSYLSPISRFALNPLTLSQSLSRLQILPQIPSSSSISRPSSPNPAPASSPNHAFIPGHPPRRAPASCSATKTPMSSHCAIKHCCNRVWQRR